MSEVKYVIGVDFGSDSVRALVVNADTGEELASDVAYYKRWMEGLYSDAAQNQFRHHPLDYLEGLEECITGALKKLPPEVAANVIGIGVDTTGSTPAPVDEQGTPLALLDEFRDNPNAMFILWKDHTAVREAAEINHLARTWGGVDYTKYEGGVYSSEWFWAKILHILRVDEQVREAAYSWVEICDWIPAVLTDTADPKVMKRSRCAAGHKAMWHPEWGGLPSEEFLTKLDPLLAGLRDRLFEETYTSDEKAGELTPEWAERLGLPVGTAVAVGAFDAHMGAVGGGIREHALVKIMGTSTCDVMVASKDQLGDTLVAGICGQVDGSVIPGMVGLEAGQSAFGDVYAWLRDILFWPLEALGEEVGLSEEALAKIRSRILVKLTEEAAKVDPATTTVVALDWLNGRRTPYADQELKGALVGLTLGTDAPRLFRALVEATAYGAKAIVDRFQETGVEIKEVIAQGGIPGKNEFVMQVSADVLGMPIKVVQSDQAVALGAAMFAAVAAGKFKDVFAAQDAMLSGYSKVYEPDPESSKRYQGLYEKYLSIGELLADTLRAL
ncbi:MAG TPA: ribulokinase [Firmicutes bacterium]|jgi:L-ribulokinase|nr:ribulokinase [Bacillota bacterium]HHT43244.1 ribulokinase [Bacillota bacterium]